MPNLTDEINGTLSDIRRNGSHASIDLGLDPDQHNVSSSRDNNNIQLMGACTFLSMNLFLHIKYFLKLIIMSHILITGREWGTDLPLCRAFWPHPSLSGQLCSLAPASATPRDPGGSVWTAGSSTNTYHWVRLLHFLHVVLQVHLQAHTTGLDFYTLFILYCMFIYKHIPLG